MVKIIAGTLIALILFSIPLWGLIAEHGLAPVLIGVFGVVFASCLLLLAINLIFNGLEELSKKKKNK